MKKIIALVLCISMVCAICATAMAGSSHSTSTGRNGSLGLGRGIPYFDGIDVPRA